LAPILNIHSRKGQNMDTQTPAEEPDMIAQVGVMLKSISCGDWSSATTEQAGIDSEMDAMIVLASAILAVAAELRAVRNELVEFQLAWKVRQ
jgi:hypothetical protein